MCGPTQVECHILSGFEAVAANGLKELTKAIGNAALEAMNGVATFWIKQPSPTLVVGADSKAPERRVRHNQHAGQRDCDRHP